MFHNVKRNRFINVYLHGDGVFEMADNTQQIENH